MPWYIFALGSAVVWGLHYVVLANAMKYIAPQTAFFLTTLSGFIILAFYGQQVLSDLKLIADLPVSKSAPILFIILTSVSGTMLLYMAAISNTILHASLIEITYPIFVAIFSIIFLSGTTISLGTVIGGLMIIAGSWVVIWTT